MTQTAEKFSVTAWRDHDEEACTLPGMALGTIDLPGATGEACDRLWRSGARRVALDEPVDLTATGAAAERRAVDLLCLVRELTARAVHVDWDLRLPAEGGAHQWKLLSHLQPPRVIDDVTDADAALYAWRTNHYLCKFVWRQGPGFVQIRDRRWGELRRFTADEPEYRAAIEALDFGVDHREVPPAVLAEFTEELLVLRVGDLAWWLPYRVNRWLQEAMAI
ncbi:hypothetical protein SUDANB176_00369 [Streptomyces sp. enrichment culture]|uniref:DUF5825 family protein n=1 Tax=Streptomyces sp. enrichment culture TaxID=1795815 RepID=UPI003F54AC52